MSSAAKAPPFTMADTTAFWGPFEREAGDLAHVMRFIDEVAEHYPGRRFAWRGHPDAKWPLHSSLYRRLAWTIGAPPKEVDLAEEEGRILADLHRWGLHMAEYGRLSVLAQLAVLQHYGAPTRLIDISFNPMVALWFAVQARIDIHGQVVASDARLFAVDVTDRLINENDALRSWEDHLSRPWPHGASPSKGIERIEWTRHVWAWRPPQFHPRLAAQNGGFLLGGVPTTHSNARWPSQTTRANPKWNIPEVRSATSVAVRPNVVAPAGGPGAQQPLFSLRIQRSAVEDIRGRLEGLYGYVPATIYPDYTGFAEFGTPRLHRAP